MHLIELVGLCSNSLRKPYIFPRSSKYLLDSGSGGGGGGGWGGGGGYEDPPVDHQVKHRNGLAAREGYLRVFCLVLLIPRGRV